MPPTNAEKIAAIDHIRLDPIIHVDATPDDEYPLRILRAYRHNCDVIWSGTTSELDESNPVVKFLNDCNRKRAKILDNAIAILESIREELRDE